MKTLITLLAMTASLSANASPAAPDYCKTDAIAAAATKLGIEARTLQFTQPHHATAGRYTFDVTFFSINPAAMAYDIAVTATDSVTGGSRTLTGQFDVQSCQ